VRPKKNITQADDGMRMYAALDVHKVYSQIAVEDEDGVLLREERLENDPDMIEKFSDSLPPDTSMVLESSSSWYWMYSILSKRHNVILSNPIKTKAIASAKVKTDRVDALTLVNLLRGGYIPECYVPPKRIMEFRELVRYRANLVRMRSNVKNRMHAYLLMNNVRISAKPFTKEFIDEVRKIEEPRVKGYLRLIDSLNDEMHEASRIICERASNDEDAKLLMTIPGISFFSALLIGSEIGDVSRFPDAYHLISYAGLVPSTHSSGDTTYHGRITKAGSPELRWILNQCARVYIREEPDSEIAAFYNRLRKKKGDSKAIVAASAKLLKIVYWVLKEKREYYHG
jgi:transposase